MRLPGRRKARPVAARLAARRQRLRGRRRPVRLGETGPRRHGSVPPMTVTEATAVVVREVSDGIAVLTLNRPDRLNAWVPAMQRRYFDLLEEAGRDPEVRVIVVTGAGRGFCAGADMQALQAMNSGESDGTDGTVDSRPQT